MPEHAQLNCCIYLVFQGLWRVHEQLRCLCVVAGESTEKGIGETVINIARKEYNRVLGTCFGLTHSAGKGFARLLVCVIFHLLWRTVGDTHLRASNKVQAKATAYNKTGKDNRDELHTAHVNNT